ncbi:alpha/beta-hydrolase [Obba rivulosa]|uniref:Alpha/beta-hydrolase n=1 Tax=Obba rivulosa TaxID=1052685 RepID=A0A8E2AXS8_9APHY|nr:alpha/beta-hydrolase [Obba rivulosa]
MPAQDSPSVVLDKATFIGICVNHTDEYLGIPYAQPPGGNLRFRLPVAVKQYSRVHNATIFGDVCPQEISSVIAASGFGFLDPFEVLYAETFPTPVVNQSGLSVSKKYQNILNVYVPEGTKSGANLPVVIHELSAERSVRPTVNSPQHLIYRVAFGFVPGQEAKDAGITNLGLRDPIHPKFGGDKSRVTMWGANSGSISAEFQMLNNGSNSEGLFSGAWMQSGFPIPLNAYSDLQGTYDILVNATSCQGSSDSLDLRQLPFEELKLAVSAAQRFGSNRSPVEPKQGGADSCTEDEGVIGALNLTSITTDDETAAWLRDEGLSGLSMEQVEQSFAQYPSDPAAGSPFGTDDLYAITPQYKCLAALIGGIEYHGQRRFFLNHKPIVWGMQWSRAKEDETTERSSELSTKSLAGWPANVPDVATRMLDDAKEDRQPAGIDERDRRILRSNKANPNTTKHGVGRRNRGFLVVDLSGNTSGYQNAWSYLSKEFKFPFISALDLSDLLNIWGSGDLTDRLINFVAHGDPNNGSGIFWPQWTIHTLHQLNVQNDSSFTMEDDTFRSEGINLMMALNIQFPE